ncbi:MAG: carboxypeptidase regulatory-like domain-containing protein, partial [Candidatus Hydrogenedentota bacterium]
FFLFFVVSCANERALVSGKIVTATSDLTQPVEGAEVKIQVQGDDRFTKTFSDKEGKYTLEVIIDDAIEKLYPPQNGENSDLRSIPSVLFVTKQGYKDVAFPINIQIRFETTQDVTLEPE